MHAAMAIFNAFLSYCSHSLLPSLPNLTITTTTTTTTTNPSPNSFTREHRQQTQNLESMPPTTLACILSIPVNAKRRATLDPRKERAPGEPFAAPIRQPGYHHYLHPLHTTTITPQLIPRLPPIRILVVHISIHQDGDGAGMGITCAINPLVQGVGVGNASARPGVWCLA
ncbi:hypothetical protein EDC01DRAFT_517761 [Geopyxis carbonaria]|nr:hypothetical protein EDC01DRAFT_517761 [Geopyxis carbonaria]